MKIECFAYNANGACCNALIRTECENCRFYKTKAQQAQEKENALRRLKAREQYFFLKDKYHLE